MHYTYWIESDELFVAGDVQGIVWHGKPDGEAVLKAVSVPGEQDCIVLLNYQAYKNSKHGPSRNLIRCNPNGAVLWQAALPSPTDQDCYTDVSFESKLNAFTWSCYSVVLNEQTGGVLAKTFTK